ncbi:MAG: dihydropyrimidinase [Desulfitobacteriaceae bacterium]
MTGNIVLANIKLPLAVMKKLSIGVDYLLETVLIKNGWITTSSDMVKGDVYIVGEKIVSWGTKLNDTADILIDATDKFVFPGAIDGHVHMNIPCSNGDFSAGYDTESIAAAVGGTTSMIDYVLQESGQTLWHSIEQSMAKAENHSAIDFGFHVIITEPNDGSLKEIKLLAEKGITSFKLFMANDIAMRDRDLFRFMQELKRHGCTACVHAENKDIISYLQECFIANGEFEPYYHALSRPEQAEIEAINRAITLAELTGCPTLIAHISTAKGLELVKEAKSRGLEVYGETCPHYLILSQEEYKKGDFESSKYVLSPPLRNKENHKGLWAGVLSNGVDIVSSDHNGFSFSTHKQLGKNDFRQIPNGAPGIEHRFNLIYHYGIEKGMNPIRLVELVSTNPAKIFGLYPQKGSLAPGSDADIVIFDPKAENTISAKNQKQDSDYTPYEQFHLHGKVETVLLRGKLIVEKGAFVGSSDKGLYVKRSIKHSQGQEN